MAALSHRPTLMLQVPLWSLLRLMLRALWTLWTLWRLRMLRTLWMPTTRGDQVKADIPVWHGVCALLSRLGRLACETQRHARHAMAGSRQCLMGGLQADVSCMILMVLSNGAGCSTGTRH